MAKPKAAELIARIEQYRGNVSAVARSYGVSRQAVHNWINASSTAQQALHDARESMLDTAESMLYKKIVDGDNTMIIFLLKTQGKERGYSERFEHTGRDGGPIVMVNWDEPGDPG